MGEEDLIKKNFQKSIMVESVKDVMRRVEEREGKEKKEGKKEK